MKRSKLLQILLAASLVLAFASIAALGGLGGRKLSAELTGAAEVPGPGDADGSGFVTLRLNPGLEQVCWDYSVADVDPITAAHIHEAPAGVAGGVVVPLFPPLPDADGNSSGCVDADRELILDIIKNPEEYYVNVHNALYPAGALRGQLSK
jgi:hypothetical protein